MFQILTKKQEKRMFSSRYLIFGKNLLFFSCFNFENRVMWKRIWWRIGDSLKDFHRCLSMSFDQLSLIGYLFDKLIDDLLVDFFLFIEITFVEYWNILNDIFFDHMIYSWFSFNLKNEIFINLKIWSESSIINLHFGNSNKE